MSLPVDPDFGKGFQFGVDNLTPMGMRERMILGRHSRDKYINHVKKRFLEDFNNENDLYVQSTDVYRTLQSVKSELLGFFPPGTAEKLTEGEKEALKEGKTQNGFNIRNRDEINEKLKDEAVWGGYNIQPVFTFSEKGASRDIDYSGCS